MLDRLLGSIGARTLRRRHAPPFRDFGASTLWSSPQARRLGAVGMRSRICSVSKKTRLIDKKFNAIEYFKCYTFRLAVSAISSVNGLMMVAELYRKIVKVNENNYLAIT